MTTRRIAILIVLVVLATLGVYRWRTTQGAAEPGSSRPAPGSGPGGPLQAPSVQAIVLDQSEFTDEVALTGQVVADQSVEVRPEINGRIAAISFREGADVRAGQVLATLVADDLVARRQKLEQQRQLEVRRVDRLRSLKALNGVSAEELETAETQAAIRVAEIAEVDAQIARTQIRAPFAGRVGLRALSLGAVVGPNSLLTTLTSVGTLNIDVALPERYVGTVSVGSTLNLRLRGADTSRRTASVVAIEPLLDERSRTQRIRARLSSATGLASGMFADVLLRRETIRNAIMVPSEAVVQDMNGATVFRLRSGRAEAVLVGIGARTMTQVQVTSGLAAGDTIITSGILFVKPGKPVKATVQ
ncbi:MAG: efflux RND transporter periplasmic adaptor subunit [Candidatus Kapabacteria bacterium]|nr:efflux RND transporter periplasmic adaptor subunit [Candidatus Kapabacteria bacterium]